MNWANSQIAIILLEIRIIEMLIWENLRPRKWIRCSWLLEPVSSSMASDDNLGFHVKRAYSPLSGRYQSLKISAQGRNARCHPRVFFWQLCYHVLMLTDTLLLSTLNSSIKINNLYNLIKVWAKWNFSYFCLTFKLYVLLSLHY